MFDSDFIQRKERLLGTRRGGDKCVQDLVGGDLKEGAHLEDLGVDGRLTFI